MKIIKLFFLLFLTVYSNISFGQKDVKKNEYVKFYKDSVEYQTNGKDTICIIDTMPMFSGGNDKIAKFIKKNLKYPKQAFRNNVEGVVKVRFIVDKTGTIRDVTIIKKVSEDLDNEALRVIKKMPKWKPGIQKGKAVSVQFVVPIVFKL